jgi:outer membrane protein assembly factor BamB
MAHFIAADAKNGKLLWHFNTGPELEGGSNDLCMVDGNQYIGIAAGSTILAFRLR